MPKRLLLLNLLLVSTAVVSSVQLVRTFLASPQLPLPPPVRAAQPAAPQAEEQRPAAVPLASYDAVASKNLFNPNRSEAAAAAAAPSGKPFLYGITVTDGTPAAYLEDPTTKKVLAYKVGDAVAGGQLERIDTDRVVIRRTEGTFEVLLRDPQKPKPVAAAQPGMPTVRAPLPAPPTAQPQPLSPTLFRRPQAPAVPPARNAPDS